MRTMTGIIVGSLLVLALIAVPLNASDVTYKVRSTVYDSSNPSVENGDL